MPHEPITVFAFIDESGDPNLPSETKGVSQYYVITSIIIDSTHLSDVERQASEVIFAGFSTGEMKSSAVGSDIKRREKILKDLTKVEFRHYSLVINKNAIFTDSGLQYRRTFYKFLHRLLFTQMRKAFGNLHIIADEFGRSEFMDSFKRYVARHFKPSLFETVSFEYASSKDYLLVQVADFIAGTIRRIFSGEDPVNLLAIIEEKTILIEEWPPNILTPKHLCQGSNKTIDTLIREQALRQASVFLEDHSDSEDVNTRAQVELLKYLLYFFKAIDPTMYVSTTRIQKHLGEAIGFDEQEQAFRSGVVASLRDNDVIIASSPKGYKIPYCLADIMDFVSLVNGQVVPSLRRLEKIRNQYLLSSRGELDIVSRDIFPDLWIYLKSQANALVKGAKNAGIREDSYK